MGSGLKDHYENESFVCSAYDSMFNFTEEAIAMFDRDLNIVRSNEHFNELVLLYSTASKKDNILDLIKDEEDISSFYSIFDDNTLNKEIILTPPGETAFAFFRQNWVR